MAYKIHDIATVTSQSTRQFYTKFVSTIVTFQRSIFFQFRYISYTTIIIKLN